MAKGNTGKKARGVKTRQEIKTVVFTLLKNNPNMKATAIQRQIARLYPKTAPKIRKIQDLVKDFRPTLDKLKTNPLEKPWSVGTLKDYSLPPEIIPTLLKIQKLRRDEHDTPLTIREAQWAYRIHGIVENKRPGINEPELIDIIDIHAQQYAVSEQLYEHENHIEIMADEKPLFDTSGLDRELYDAEYSKERFSNITGVPLFKINKNGSLLDTLLQISKEDGE